MNAEEVVENIQKTARNSSKLLTKCLKYLGKIEHDFEAEDYQKQMAVGLIEWFLEYFVVKPFILLFLVAGLNLFRFLSITDPIKAILFAYGLSMAWFVFIQVRKDWREIK